jgi:hypothetical protein
MPDIPMHPSEIGKTCGPFVPKRREAMASAVMKFSSHISALLLEIIAGFPPGANWRLVPRG